MSMRFTPLALAVLIWTVASVNAYGQGPISVPGKIEVEQYDSFFDTSAGNSSGGCRTDDVDLVTSDSDQPDLPTNCLLEGTRAGEWLGFTIVAAQTDTYVLSIRVRPHSTDVGGGGTFHVEIDGVDVSGTMRVPYIPGDVSPGWWTTMFKHSISLTAGQHTVKLKMDSESPTTGRIGRFNYLALTKTVPFEAAPFAVPGTIEAENFDRNPSGASGETFAYHDWDAANVGNAAYYRPGEAVDIWDGVSGQRFIDMTTGEWISYTVDIAVAGKYSLYLRVVHPGVGGRLHFELDGNDITGPITIPDTGGYPSWETIEVTTLPLPTGVHVLTVVGDQESSLGVVADAIDYFTFVPANNTNPHSDFGVARYGIVSALYTPEHYSRIEELGVGSVRADVPWDDSQPSPTEFTFDALQKALDLLRPEKYPQASLYLSVGGDMPSWAAPGPQDPPYRYEDYGAFFEAVLRHTREYMAEFGGDPTNVVFGVWNEPDLDMFLKDDNSGTVYSRLFREASLARDRVDPNVRIGGPETSWHARFSSGNFYFQNVMPRIAPYLRSWDIVTVHWYADADQTVLDYMNGVSDAAGGRQVWLTEAGHLTCDDPTQTDVVANIIFGMEDQRKNWWRTFIYRLWPGDTWGPNCDESILTPAYEPREAYWWYQTRINVVTSSYSLEPGGALYPNQYVTSPEAQYGLFYQGDGNLVLYPMIDPQTPDVANPLWWSCTEGTQPNVAAMQTDGNFVVYDAVGSVPPPWHSHTDTYPGAYLSVRDYHGDVVVYRANGQVLWESTTPCQ
jgi:hypothetical protein